MERCCCPPLPFRVVLPSSPTCGGDVAFSPPALWVVLLSLPRSFLFVGGAAFSLLFLFGGGAFPPSLLLRGVGFSLHPVGGAAVPSSFE